jgi:DNA-binding beta-propeller fold protein YncE
MKASKRTFITLVAALAALTSSYPALAQSINPPIQEISLPGSPFAVTTTPDGRYVFASLSGDANGIAIVRTQPGTNFPAFGKRKFATQGQPSASLVRILATGGGNWGLAVTPDGRYLLDTVQPIGKAATPQGLQIIDIQKAIAGDAGAIVATVGTGAGSGPIEVGLSNDNRFVFVTNEDNETVSVIDFWKAIATGGNASSVVGLIPVENLPVGLAFSGDGRYLYLSNESANTTDPGYNAAACNTPTGIGTGTTPGPEGTLTVVDVHQAETNPAKSVLASVYAGCSPVRVVLSEDSSVAWVTARAQDDVLAFSTRELLSDPSHALLSTTPVGTAPVGIQLFDHDRFIAVANSNRFTVGQTGTVSILDYHKALSGAGDSATLGTFPAGDFPRQWDLSGNDQYLYLTEFSSNILAILAVPPLIQDVE